MDSLVENPETERDSTPEVHVYVSDDVAGALDEAADSGGQRTLAICWSKLPALRVQQRALLNRLAHAALSLWPDWPADTLSTAWRRLALEACAGGRAPLFRRLPLALQLQQLGVALRATTLVVAVDNALQDARHLEALAANVYWLSQNTGRHVNVYLPATLSEHPALQRLMYSPRRLVSRAPALKQLRLKRLLRPWLGRPHPFSPGERRLAAALDEDPQLRGLFRRNQTVDTCLFTHPIADFVWLPGRLVVEVHGYEYHTSPRAFATDRQRDFELTLSGYRILRLTHDEIMHALPSALEKIRQLVTADGVST